MTQSQRRRVAAYILSWQDRYIGEASEQVTLADLARAVLAGEVEAALTSGELVDELKRVAKMERVDKAVAAR